MISLSHRHTNVAHLHDCTLDQINYNDALFSHNDQSFPSHGRIPVIGIPNTGILSNYTEITFHCTDVPLNHNLKDRLKNKKIGRQIFFLKPKPTQVKEKKRRNRKLGSPFVLTDKSYQRIQNNSKKYNMITGRQQLFSFL